LTPRVLGRYLLYKPPLLAWLAGGSLKVFRKSLFALRLPALVAAVLGTVCIFSWIFAGGTVTAASASILLLLSSPLWHAFARLCYTDMLLAASTVGAMLCLYIDPQLKSRSSLIWFAILTAAGIMAKNVAGFLPLLILLLYAGLLGRPNRPSLPRIG